MNKSKNRHSLEGSRQQNNVPELQQEVESTAYGQVQSLGPLQEEVSTSIKSFRSRSRVKSKVGGANGEVSRQSLKFDRRLSFQGQNHIKSSKQTKPFVQNRDSRFKIRLPGESSKGFKIYEQNGKNEKFAQRKIMGKKLNLQQKKEFGGDEQEIMQDQNLHHQVIQRGFEGNNEKLICQIGKKNLKQFCEQFQDQDRDSGCYFDREVVYLIRVHFAAIDGPSLQGPGRTDSFQVNIQYECIGREICLASSILSVSEENGDYGLAKKQGQEIYVKEENGMEELKNGFIEKSLGKGDGFGGVKERVEGSLNHCENCESKFVQKVGDEQKQKILEFADKKRLNLAETGSIYNIRICPYDALQEIGQVGDVDKNKILPEKIQELKKESLLNYHKKFENNKFEEKGYESVNKRLSKKRQQKQNIKVIQKNGRGMKMKERQERQKVKKRNINEYRIKQIIRQAKDQVKYERAE